MEQFKKAIHEIIPKDRSHNIIVEDMQENRYEVFSSSWSGYYAYCLNHNGQIMMEEKVNYFGQKRLVKKCITISYNSAGYKLINQANKK